MMSLKTPLNNHKRSQLLLICKCCQFCSNWHRNEEKQAFLHVITFVLKLQEITGVLLLPILDFCKILPIFFVQEANILYIPLEDRHRHWD